MAKEEEDGKVSLIREPLLSTSDHNASKGEEEHSCPYSTANLYKILNFSWLNPLLDIGNKKTIGLDDIPQLSQVYSANGIYPIFREKLFHASITGNGGGGDEISSPRLVKALFWLTWREVLCTALLSLVYICASFVGPYLIDSFVQYLNDSAAAPPFNSKGGYVLVSAFVLAKIVESFSMRHSSFKLELIGIRVKNSLVAITYDKLLTLSNQSRQGTSTGEIVNLIAVDADNVSYFSSNLHDCWRVPLQVILALLLLYRNVGGVASVAALLATVLVILANISLGRLQGTLQGQLMESKDERMKTTSEIIKNMKILKLQGWETKFLSKIVSLRENEEGWLRKRLWTETISTVSFHVSPTIVSAVTFFACVLTGIPLESGKVLSTIATVGILKEAIFDLPLLVSKFFKAKISLYRVSCFLRQKDVQANYIKNLPSTSKIAIDIKNGNFSWSSSEIPTLKDVNLQVVNGMRVGVCGTVGSGKSSLLSCILGEMKNLSGEIMLCGRKAYVSQSPWIQSGNIEENILFGNEMDREKYRRVLEACSLEKDLDVLPFGDQTIIGERGINLSGGQKQRIQIARALYQDAEIYLLDDPFSALDAHTGTHLYKECLLKFLKSKTVIYTTNQVEFLPSADLILVLKEGKITQAGTYEEILKSGTDFMDLVNAHKKALLGHKKSTPEITTLSSDIISNFEDEAGIGENSMHEEVLHDNQAQLVQEEDRQKGRVSVEVYWSYITAAYKGALVPVVVLAQVLYQILQIQSDYWMASHTPVSKDVSSPIEASTLIIYTALGSLSCIFMFARVVIVGIVGYKTATILFKQMHFCIFRAPMSFLDATPSGRILDRASEDQDEVDSYTSAMFGGFVTNTIRLLAVIGVMGQGGWQIYLIYVPVAFFCFWCQQYSITATRELGRLKGVSNAPLKQHFVESISGLTTIKCFDQDSRFKETNMKLIDRSSRSQFYSVGANEWLGFRLDMLSSFTFALALVFLISIPQGIINPAIAGLVVTYGLSLNALQVKLIWLYGLIERDIISVERILQYTCIPSEAPLVVEEHRPASDWPSRGEVTVLQLKIRYAPHLPLILDGVTCTFRGGMKTGIVGRTGSGKSTLVQTLFRIVEASAGKILIDGVDISMIGLDDLRSRLSIIPQDPTMFEGNVRSNLDPLEEYTDDQIWEALDKCKLGDEVRRMEKKLDSPVAENGENWSMGQRQLVCLSRVLLKKSKILVLDEATSSVDTATDTLMQETLRQHFSDSTVIIIAHRITSVLNSDAVLVLDKGQVVEYGSPRILLENESSWFAKLVAEQVQA